MEHRGRRRIAAQSAAGTYVVLAACSASLAIVAGLVHAGLGRPRKGRA